jgi:hypothetical protein
MMRMEVDSTEYLYVPVEATTTEGETIDVTRVAVEIGFTGLRLGPVADWLDARWAVVDEIPYARILLGPRNRGHRLPPGKWWVWVRFHAFPEVPVRRSDYLIVSGASPSQLTQIGGESVLLARAVRVGVTSGAFEGTGAVQHTEVP